mmetsp:Transcript_16406/g.19977  ORF Transcript_16406/g.19977 Transcript_16406/m.19977 type:complete len:260 (-) Transcript_16406:408-1187(-)
MRCCVPPSLLPLPVDVNAAATDGAPRRALDRRRVASLPLPPDSNAPVVTPRFNSEATLALVARRDASPGRLLLLLRLANPDGAEGKLPEAGWYSSSSSSSSSSEGLSKIPSGTRAAAAATTFRTGRLRFGAAGVEFELEFELEDEPFNLEGAANSVKLLLLLLEPRFLRDVTGAAPPFKPRCSEWVAVSIFFRLVFSIPGLMAVEDTVTLVVAADALAPPATEPEPWIRPIRRLLRVELPPFFLRLRVSFDTITSSSSS